MQRRFKKGHAMPYPTKRLTVEKPGSRTSATDPTSVDAYVDGRARAEYVLVNMSVHTLDVAVGGGEVLHLAPLERRELTPPEVARIDPDKVRRSPWVKIERVDDRLLRPWAARALRLVAAAVVLLPIVGVLILGSTGLVHLLDLVWFAVAVLVTVAVVILGGSYVLAPSDSNRLTRPGMVRELRTRIAHHISHLVVVIAAVLIPGAITWYLGGFRGAVQGVTTARDAATAFDALFAGPENTALALAWLLQLVLISSASLLPALLFYMFDRTRLGTLKHQMVRNLFRLEPRMRTLSEIDAKYGPQIAEMFGSGPKRAGRLAAGTRRPVVFATILIAAGWTSLMMHTDGGRVSDAAESGFRLISFWSSPPEIVGFAFLGAYVFALRLALRGYSRRDLRAKAYAAISVRLVSVVILAWLLVEWARPDVSGSPGWLTVAFFAGFFPDEVLQWLKERITLLLKKGAPVLPAVPTNDLHTLVGIDAYERAHFAQEGINNVQGLATADLATLLMSFRMSADQLFDWVDQAVLQLYVGRCTDAAHNDSAGLAATTLGHRLCAKGIRKATRAVTHESSLTKKGLQTGTEDEDLQKLSEWLRGDRTVMKLLAFQGRAKDVSPLVATTARSPQPVDLVRGSEFGDIGNGHHLGSETKPCPWLRLLTFVRGTTTGP